MTSAVKCRANVGAAADDRSSLHAAHPGAIRPSSDGRSKCDRTVASGSTIEIGGRYVGTPTTKPITRTTGGEGACNGDGRSC